ncbi:hypothetical protein EVAR_103321_1 [Eumeta japonica]|uniref:Uncharacterized protein n=1 Tax=Eumeta variegata TaxID=151549 RepID=A0A4C1Z6X8_EUMVA|nr:hypothetical protein EVAR_103321_1 [Eumeta japonica]
MEPLLHSEGVAVQEVGGGFATETDYSYIVLVVDGVLVVLALKTTYVDAEGFVWSPCPRGHAGAAALSAPCVSSRLTCRRVDENVESHPAELEVVGSRRRRRLSRSEILRTVRVNGTGRRVGSGCAGAATATGRRLSAEGIRRAFTASNRSQHARRTRRSRLRPDTARRPPPAPPGPADRHRRRRPTADCAACRRHPFLLSRSLVTHKLRGSPAAPAQGHPATPSELARRVDSLCFILYYQKWPVIDFYQKRKEHGAAEIKWPTLIKNINPPLERATFSGTFRVQRRSTYSKSFNLNFQRYCAQARSLYTRLSNVPPVACGSYNFSGSLPRQTSSHTTFEKSRGVFKSSTANNYLENVYEQCALPVTTYDARRGPLSVGLMMEPEGKHRNSIMKQRILAVFGLVEIVFRCTLTMNDFQGLMMQLEETGLSWSTLAAGDAIKCDHLDATAQGFRYSEVDCHKTEGGGGLVAERTTRNRSRHRYLQRGRRRCVGAAAGSTSCGSRSTPLLLSTLAEMRDNCQIFASFIIAYRTSNRRRHSSLD